MANTASARVYLTQSSINSGNPVRILCNQVNIGGKRDVDVTPNANTPTTRSPVEAQTLSYENLAISLQGVRFTPTTTLDISSTDSGRSNINVLTYEDLIALYTLDYNANAPTLTVVYGNSELGQNTVTGLAGTTDIPVILKSFSFPINVTDSRDGYMPVATLTFTETA